MLVNLKEILQDAHRGKYAVGLFNTTDTDMLEAVIEAAKTGRRTSLEHMNPYERRIIHTAVQQIEGATSWSMGSEPNRHVVITIRK